MGSCARGARSLNSMNKVDGCVRALEMKAWSARRKETRFNGDPEK